jgi:hypothetical protein
MSGKTFTKSNKCLELFASIKIYFVHMSSNGVKDEKRNVRPPKRRGGRHQLFQNVKQLKNVVFWKHEVTESPSNCM